MFNQILVPVDLSTESTTQKLCETANDLAEKYASEVILMTVIPDYGMPLVASFFPEDAQKKLKQEMNSKLEVLAKRFFNVNVTTKLIQGKRRQVILKEIENTSPDLVMLGCRRKKSRRDQKTVESC